ncbi:hypothetical protein F4802DRAFT_582010 [Xylaria palmicola]|nr:hypothetical protein F4802DRAFT_582010 [Xylaria palmicola]
MQSITPSSVPTPRPAPPFNVPGGTCHGTICGSHVSYTCTISPPDCAGLTSYEFEHLLKPHFWILAAVIIYIAYETSSNDPYQLALGALAKLSGGSGSRWSHPRSRAAQVGALVAYLGILWLGVVEASMVLSTDWRMMRKVLVVWRPRLMPLRSRLLVLYPVWGGISCLCIAVVAVTVMVGVFITKEQLCCVVEMVRVITGRRELSADYQPRDLERDVHSNECNGLGSEGKSSGESEGVTTTQFSDEKTQC